jgi:hypothetical protein
MLPQGRRPRGLSGSLGCRRGIARRPSFGSAEGKSGRRKASGDPPPRCLARGARGGFEAPRGLRLRPRLPRGSRFLGGFRVGQGFPRRIGGFARRELLTDSPFSEPLLVVGQPPTDQPVWGGQGC